MRGWGRLRREEFARLHGRFPRAHQSPVFSFDLSQSSRLAVRTPRVCSAETTKPYFVQARMSTNFDLRPNNTRARTPECPRSRRPHSLRGIPRAEECERLARGHRGVPPRWLYPV